MRLSKFSLPVIVALAAFLTLVGSWGGVSTASAGSMPNPAPTAQFLTDRFDCDAIRGTDYQSEDERTWFLTYCVGGRAATQQAPIIYYLPQDVFVLPAPVATRPAAPTVRLTCTSSFGSATANEDTQQVPLNAQAGEPVSCVANVNGSYTSIDWAGGDYNGGGPTFVTSFGFRTAPWNVRMQVNWGGNPVIKYINVTTLSAGCGFGSPFCYVR